MSKSPVENSRVRLWTQSEREGNGLPTAQCHLAIYHAAGGLIQPSSAAAAPVPVRSRCRDDEKAVISTARLSLAPHA